MEVIAPLRSRLRALWAAARAERSSPRQLALAVGLGALVGASPLVGLHTWLSVALASVFRLNRLAALLGSNVSFGPLLPLLIAAEVRLGAYVLGCAPPSLGAGLSLAALSTTTVRLWLMGYLLLGPPLALLAGGATYVVARRRPAA